MEKRKFSKIEVPEALMDMLFSVPDPFLSLEAEVANLEQDSSS